MKRALTQQEIDSFFGGGTEGKVSAPAVDVFDVRKLDKIRKSQLQSLHLVHEAFARSLASSLSAYLRSYVALNLVSLEQISYGDFLEGLSSPACLAYIGLQPYDGSAILDLNPALGFRLIELLLGSRERPAMTMQRKITDIEKKLLQTILRIVLHDLHDAWKSVAEINFSLQSLASEPQLLHVLSPAEAMLVIAMEFRLGTTAGMMNLAIPSRFITRLRNKFDQLQKIQRPEATAANQMQVGRLLQNVKLNFDVQIPGGQLAAETLSTLSVGDVLAFDHPVGAPAVGLLNDTQIWLGNVVSINGKLAFEVVKNIS